MESINVPEEYYKYVRILATSSSRFKESITRFKEKKLSQKAGAAELLECLDSILKQFYIPNTRHHLAVIYWYAMENFTGAKYGFLDGTKIGTEQSKLLMEIAEPVFIVRITEKINGRKEWLKIWDQIKTTTPEAMKNLKKKSSIHKGWSNIDFMLDLYGLGLELKDIKKVHEKIPELKKMHKLMGSYDNLEDTRRTLNTFAKLIKQIY